MDLLNGGVPVVVLRVAKHRRCEHQLGFVSSVAYSALKTVTSVLELGELILI